MIISRKSTQNIQMGRQNDYESIRKNQKSDRYCFKLCLCHCFAVMVVVGTYQIVTRYFFNSPSTVSEELLTYSFSWMALLSSALVFGKRDHMRMGFIADKLTGVPKKILEIVIELMIMIFSVSVMVWGGYTIMQLSMTQVTASLGIPMGVVYIVVPLSGVLIAIYSVLISLTWQWELTAGRQKNRKGD